MGRGTRCIPARVMQPGMSLWWALQVQQSAGCGNESLRHTVAVGVVVSVKEALHKCISLYRDCGT